jgi:hypothetical protein
MKHEATTPSTNNGTNPHEEEYVEIPGWEHYVNYIRIYRDKMRGGVPQVNLNVGEAFDLFDGMTANEVGAFILILLEHARRPLRDDTGPATGPRRLTKRSAMQLLRNYLATGSQRSRTMASLQERGCVRFCQTNVCVEKVREDKVSLDKARQVKASLEKVGEGQDTNGRTEKPESAYEEERLRGEEEDPTTSPSMLDSSSEPDFDSAVSSGEFMASLPPKPDDDSAAKDDIEF